MKNTELKPCKIHNKLPMYRERRVNPDPMRNFMHLTDGYHTIKEYYCPDCELDRDTLAKNQVIEQWNKKQG